MVFTSETGQRKGNQNTPTPDSEKAYYDNLIAYMKIASAALGGDPEARAKLKLIDAAQAQQTQCLELELEKAKLETQLAAMESIAILITGQRD